MFILIKVLYKIILINNIIFIKGFKQGVKQMMKKFIFLKKSAFMIGAFFLFALCSTSVFATDFHHFFTIAKNDVSLGLLQTIFGHVGGLREFAKVPPGSLNAMFGEFNKSFLYQIHILKIPMD